MAANDSSDPRWEELEERCAVFANNEGFPYYVFMLHRSGGFDPADVFLTNYPEKWVRRYAIENSHEVDPVVERLKTSPEPFSWGDLPLTLPQYRFMQRAREAGLGDGLGLGLHYDLADYASFCLSGTEPTTDPLKRRELYDRASAFAHFCYDEMMGVLRQQPTTLLPPKP